MVCLSGCSATAAPRPGPKPQLFSTKGTPWTIQCIELSGHDRASHIEDFAKALRSTPVIRPGDVFVRHDEDGFARLYYGTYFRRTDPKTGKRDMPKQLTEDMELIKQLGDPSGRRYFLRAMIVRSPTPNVGNPAWDLARALAKYTLQVAAFEPTEDFWEYKQAAADYCEWLRKKGYEAYYHHSSSSSVVTVGLFGPDAVIERAAGLPYYSDAVVALQRDELLKYNLLNGGIYYVREKDGKRVAMPSRLVEVPGGPGSKP